MARILIEAKDDGSQVKVFTDFIDSATYEEMVKFAMAILTNPDLGSAIEMPSKFER